MKKLTWFIAGIALGMVAARQVEENPAARQALEDAKRSALNLKDAVVEGYKEREAELAKPKPKRTTTSSSTRPKNKPASK
jgi:hypothetical protein